MWVRTYCEVQEFRKFFSVILSHDNLQNYFRTNFALMQHHKYNLTELENMMPWERHAYIDLLLDYIKQQEEKARDQRAIDKRR